MRIVRFRHGGTVRHGVLPEAAEEGRLRVLDGDRTGVRSLDLRPGDLQLFRGRNTLHRVTAPAGATERLGLLLSYVTDPAHVVSPDYAMRLWGEVHPRHLEAAAR